MSAALELLRKRIVAATTGDVAASNVEIDGAIDSDWDGSTRILIRETSTETEYFQLGGALERATATVGVVADDRETAARVGKKIRTALERPIESRSDVKAVSVVSFQVSSVFERGVKRREAAALLKCEVYSIER